MSQQRLVLENANNSHKHPPDDLTREISPDDDPPAFQQFRKTPLVSKSPLPMDYLAEETDRGAIFPPHQASNAPSVCSALDSIKLELIAVGTSNNILPSG